MLKTGVVQVSGRGTSVNFTIDDTSPFDEVTQGLRRYFVDNRGLWSKGSITVNAGLRITSRDQLSQLKAIIEKESGLTVARFWCSPDRLDQPSSKEPAGEPQGQVSTQEPEHVSALPSETAAETPVRPRSHNEYTLTTTTPVIKLEAKPKNGTATATSALRSLPLIPSNPEDAREPVDSQLDLGMAAHLDIGRAPNHTDEATDPLFRLSGRAQDTLDAIDYMESRRDTALFIKSTCRSGEIIQYEGDVVVLGDVNPGAEIIAAGDITVFGALRGLAHAGSQGLTKAVIIAYRLESPRLEIGPYVGVAADPLDGERIKSTGAGPMIAYVRRRSIYMAAFVGRFAKYNRGIPYEG